MQRWIVNLCPLLHFDNSRLEDYEHNISIVSWNVKSVLDYLDVSPNHKFCLDQVTLLEGFERLFPNYWDALHQAILEGRVEIVGGTYVMPDFIIPDGESIIRQFLYGSHYFREKFGIEVKTGWAIDSPGHCSQLPQILRQCGIDSYYFYRGMPFDAPSEFIWKAPDGSRVNAVWLTQGYDCASWLSENTREAFTKLIQIIDRAGERAASQNVLVPVGGELVPPLPHLHDIVDQWNKTFSDMKAVIVTPLEFTEKLKSVQAQLPLISGELNSGRFSPILTGGLSSRSLLKQYNREIESLLYLTECYLTIAEIHDKNELMVDIWKMLLFNQDHNIIRGVLTDETYKLAINRYKKALEMVQNLLEDAVQTLSMKIGNDSTHYSFVVFNPLPWVRSDVVRIPVDLTGLGSEYFEIRDPDDNSIVYQLLESESESNIADIILVAKDMPSMGHRVYRAVPVEKQSEFDNEISSGKDWIESDQYVIEFDDFNGAISRLFDKKNQIEVLRSNGGYLVLESDVGDLYRYSKSELESENGTLSTLRYSGKIEIIEDGPVRAEVQISGDFRESKRTQRLAIYNGISRIDIENVVEFKGQDARLRVMFPLTVFNDRVNTGSQFCSETKSTVSVSSRGWNEEDTIMFSALDWLDCKGPDYGICLSAPGIHEFSFEDGLLGATLLRSVDHVSRGKDDDVVSTESARENGVRDFRLSLIPHKGGWKEAQAWKRAAEHRVHLISYPLELSTGDLPLESSFLEIDGLNLSLSCLKPTDTQGEFIVRLFDIEGKSGTASITFASEIESVVLVDMCEREIGEISFDERTVNVPVDAYSIITLKVRFALI